MLVGQPPFGTVFTKFLKWIEKCVEEACCGNNELYCPGIHICIHRIYSYIVYVHIYITVLLSFYLVLVAHNGFNFDFPFLMEEIRRCNLKESFEKVDLWFADTWYDANRVSSWLTNIYNTHIPMYVTA